MFIVKTFGGKIFLVPRVNIPWGIKIPDYFWNGEYWDLKAIEGSSKRAIDNVIKHNKNQCNNFIIDCTKCSIPDNEIFNQTTSIFQSKYRLWVNKIMIIKDEKVVLILKRK